MSQEPFPGKKFLVLRRDGTIPDWPWFVLGGEDPMAPGALHIGQLPDSPARSIIPGAL